eukprot:scaffold1484_cov173-Amphora_coffeaeformis.AAC.24
MTCWRQRTSIDPSMVLGQCFFHSLSRVPVHFLVNSVYFHGVIPMFPPIVMAGHDKGSNIHVEIQHRRPADGVRLVVDRSPSLGYTVAQIIRTDNQLFQRYQNQWASGMFRFILDHLNEISEENDGIDTTNWLSSMQSTPINEISLFVENEHAVVVVEKVLVLHASTLHIT